MLYNQDLIDIINKQNFKQFFVLLDYLLIAGFKEVDAVGIALKHFPENKIWENVAFIRQYEKPDIRYVNAYNGIDYNDPFTIHEDMNGNKIKPKILIIGILDENTIHLSGMFDVYRKDVCENAIIGLNPAEDLEQNCKIQLKFKMFSYFIEKYLNETFKKHFGYDMILKDSKPNNRPTANDAINRLTRRNIDNELR